MQDIPFGLDWASWAQEANNRAFKRKKKIQISNIPYGAHLLFAKKKDGQIHLCIDYCALNKNTISDSYLLSCIKELLSQLKGAQYFSYLDLRDWYFHFTIAKEDLHKTVFSCRVRYIWVPCYAIWAYKYPKYILR